jgi:hypothetical protein
MCYVSGLRPVDHPCRRVLDWAVGLVAICEVGVGGPGIC